MKMKITKNDGTIIEAEGTPEECAQLLQPVEKAQPAKQQGQAPFDFQKTMDDFKKTYPDWNKQFPPCPDYPGLGDPIWVIPPTYPDWVNPTITPRTPGLPYPKIWWTYPVTTTGTSITIGGLDGTSNTGVIPPSKN